MHFHAVSLYATVALYVAHSKPMYTERDESRGVVETPSRMAFKHRLEGNPIVLHNLCSLFQRTIRECFSRWLKITQVPFLVEVLILHISLIHVDSLQVDVASLSPFRSDFSLLIFY